MNKLFQLMLIMLTVSAQAVIIPGNRRITWDPGVRNGVEYYRPGGAGARTTIYTTLTSSSTADQIQTALNACPSGQVVALGSGTFSLNHNLNIPSNVTLRGAGLDVTILQSITSGSFTGIDLVHFNNSFDSSWSASPLTLTSPTKGDTTITTTADHGFSVGDIVLIDQLGQTGDSSNPAISNSGSLGTATWVGRASGARANGQWVKIQSIPTTKTATISPELYWTYTNTPQATKMGGASGITNLAGVEDLTLDTSLTGTSSTARDIVGIFGAVNCWLYNVHLKGIYRYSTWGYGALWFTMQHCRISEGIPVGTDNSAAYDSDRSYGMFFGPHFSAGLITDNIVEKVTMGWSREGAVSGCVFSYNLVKDVWWKSTGDSPRRFSSLGHGPHPMMNLDEGNWLESRVRADEYWGTSSHNTFLRNRIAQIDRGASDAQTWTVDIERKNQFYNFVGNIIGNSTGISVGGVVENKYEKIAGTDSAPYSDTNSTVWKLGYQSLGTDGTLKDDVVASSILRWGNWSQVTFGDAASGVDTHYTANVQDTGDTTIPDSYYLSGKPTWFGSLSYPVFNATGVGTVAKEQIPAGYRYTNGVDPTTDTSPPTPNPSTIASAVSLGTSSVLVTATTATDAGSPPVLYRFSKDAGSTWTAYQSSAVYDFTGLAASTLYPCQVQAEDSAGSPNVTTASASTDVTTDASATSTPKGPASGRQRRGFVHH